MFDVPNEERDGRGAGQRGILWVACLAYLDELISCLLSARPAAAAAAGPRRPFPQ